MANSQSCQKRATHEQQIIFRPYLWAKVTYFIKFWSQSKIPSAFWFQNNKLHYFITNAQIGNVFFLWLLNYNFPPFSCSLDNSNTIFYLEVALKFFLTRFYHEMAYLLHSLITIKFSNTLQKKQSIPTLKQVSMRSRLHVWLSALLLVSLHLSSSSKLTGLK